MKQLIVALIAALSAAIRTPREDTARLRELNEENEKLKARLAEEDLEDAEVEELRPQIDEVLALAAAARPPSDDQINIARAGLSGTGVSQDPAQPPGSPAPGNPEVEKQAAESKTTRPRSERVEDLVDSNSRDELAEKAEALEIEVHSSATKTEIAEAIVDKEDSKSNW